MVTVRYFGSTVDVIFKERIIITLVGEDWGIEVYDYINDEFIDVKSSFLKEALEEIRTCIESIAFILNEKPSNKELDEKRKDILKVTKAMEDKT